MDKDLIADELKRTLLGRIKLKTIEHISGRKNVFPTKSQFLNFVKNEKNNAPLVWAHFLKSIIKVERSFPIGYSEILESRKELNDVYNSLLESFTEESVSFFVFDCPAPLPEELIVWVVKVVDNSGHQSFALIIGDESAPQNLLLYLIVSRDENNEIQISEITDKSNSENSEIYNKQTLLDLAICCFVGCDILSPFRLIPVSKIGKLERKFDNDKYAPPSDTKFMKYIYEVKSGVRNCVKAIVDLDKLKFKDLNFAYSIPDQFVLNHLEFTQQIQKYGILTYEFNGNLIVSDDYLSLFALKVCDSPTVMVINMGEFQDIIPIREIDKGNSKLLPPVLVVGSGNNLSETYKLERISEKIKTIKQLKKILVLLNDDFETIRNAIGKNKLRMAFLDLNMVCLDPILLNRLIAIEGRYNKLLEDISFGVLDKRDEAIGFNKIRKDLLEMLNEI